MSPATSPHPWWERATRLAVPALVVVFYLPFIPRGFYGDDWFWLEWAQRSLDNPELFFTRPIYGYFRPLYMVYVAIVTAIFGTSAPAFGIVNLLLHAANVWQLDRLLRRWGVTTAVSTTAALFFGCYFLYATTLGWISAGSDILTVFCLLWLIGVLQSQSDETPFRFWIAVIALSFAAIMTKEAGLISLPLVVVFLLVNGENPFKRPHRDGMTVYLVLVVAYLIAYFATRTVVDKPLAISWDTVIDLWYLYVYQVIPISERMVAMFPAGAKPLLIVGRLIVAFGLPLLWIWWFRRGDRLVRFFLIWSVIAVGPAALLVWDLSLFSLYPERTASRFMYTAGPGLAVFVATVVVAVIRRLSTRNWLPVAVLALFVAGNAGVVYKVTRLYHTRQHHDTIAFEALQASAGKIRECESIQLTAGEEARRQTPFDKPDVVASMLYLVTDHDARLSIVDPGVVTDALPETNYDCRLSWDDTESRFAVRKVP